MSDEVKKVCLCTVEVKATELPLVQDLIDALRNDLENLPEGVKQAINAILTKGCK